MNTGRFYLTIVTCWLLIGMASAEQPKCPKGFQPYADHCISQRMSDYIDCVVAAGGNRQKIALEISNAQAAKTGVK
jgi:hypothetical protein